MKVPRRIDTRYLRRKIALPGTFPAKIIERRLNLTPGDDEDLLCRSTTTPPVMSPRRPMLEYDELYGENECFLSTFY